MLNLIHSILFVALSLFVQHMSQRSYLIFKKEHYNFIRILPILAVLLYLIPLFGIIGLSWYHGGGQEDASSDGDNKSQGKSQPSSI